MTLAIKTCLGDIICKDKPLSVLRFYVRVNPMATVVKLSKGKWVPVYPNGIVFSVDE